MQALICERYGDLGSLHWGDWPEPRCDVGELLIEVAAWGVSYADLVFVNGAYYLKPIPPFVPGMEISGTVLKCGAHCTIFQPGDTVAAYVESGGYADYVVAREDAAMRIPAGRSVEDACVLPATFGTSLVALQYRAAVEPGATVLILGAGGGVGAAAVQVAKRLDCSVVAAASTTEKLALAHKAGADVLINHLEVSLREAVFKGTRGRGVNVVFDPVGGALAHEAARCLRPEGTYLVIGFAAGTIPSFAAGYILIKELTIVGSSWTGTWKRHPRLIRNCYTTLSRWHAEHPLSMSINRRLARRDAVKALTALSERRSIGKIVLTRADQ